MDEKFSEFFRGARKPMSDVAFAQGLMQEAGSAIAGSVTKVVLPTLARRLGVPLCRAKALWYGDARRIDAAEMDRLRALAAERKAIDERNEKAARDEYRQVMDQLAVIAARLSEIDAHIRGARADRLLSEIGRGVGEAGESRRDRSALD